jgi:hypothetical protein
MEAVVKYSARQLQDTQSTVLARLATHTHEPIDITANTLHEARYEQTSAQSIPNLTDSKVWFNSAVTTSADVTASGTNNTDFLLNRSGLWRVSACIRYNTGSGGERHLFAATGTVLGTLANRFMGSSDAAVGVGAGNLSASTEIRVAASTSVFVGTFQSNGGTLAIDTGFGHMNHIALTWLRP